MTHNITHQEAYDVGKGAALCLPWRRVLTSEKVLHEMLGGGGGFKGNS